MKQARQGDRVFTLPVSHLEYISEDNVLSVFRDIYNQIKVTSSYLDI